jgi:hypothetical protein
MAAFDFNALSPTAEALRLQMPLARADKAFQDWSPSLADGDGDDGTITQLPTNDLAG